MVALAVPERPLLKPWYRLAALEDAVLLEHAGTVVRFTGAAAQVLLPRLLPLLDGSRTTDELIELVGRPVEAAVTGALDLLAEHRLLIDGPAQSRRPDAEALAEVASVPVSGIASRLVTSEVGIVGPRAPADALARLLHAAGVGTVRRPWQESVDLTVVLTTTPLEEDSFDIWNRRALDEDIVWLPVGDYDGATATVGPLVIPRETACHECFVLRRHSTSGCAAELADLRRSRRTCLLPAVLEALVLALTAHVVVRWLAVRDPGLPGSVTMVETSGALTIERQQLLRVPRCPACAHTSCIASPLPWHETERVLR
jgi:bacteriocin biosynthesis cyclodehydratase domain-containing protein